MIKSFLTQSILISVFLAFSVAQADIPVELMSQQWGNSEEGIAVSGNLAYVGIGPRLVILDISQPSNPVKLGQSEVLPSVVQDVFVSGNYAYVAERHGGLAVIDISDSNNPVCEGEYSIDDYVLGVTVSGDYAYLAQSSNGLEIIDISNPNEPNRVGGIDTGYANHVAVSGDFAYVSGSGLTVVDISNPNAPASVGNCDTPSSATGVAVSGHYAYVSTQPSGLKVIDISNPANPTIVGSYDMSRSRSENIAVVGDVVYLADGWGGLEIISVSNPNLPEHISVYNTIRAASGIAVLGTHAYVVGTPGGLEIIDVSNLSEPEYAGEYRSTWIDGIEVSGSYAYLSAFYSGIYSVDISNPVMPTLLSIYESWNPYGFDLSGDYIYLAAANGLNVIDVSKPAEPNMVGFWSAHTRDVFVWGNYAYVCTLHLGGPVLSQVLAIVDISNPIEPNSIATADFAYVEDVDVSGHFAYIATTSDTLYILDISNPSSPVYVTEYNTGDYIFNVEISGNYAYLANGNDGLQILDISNPNLPAYVGGLDTRFARDVVISGSYACVADWDEGLKIIDISNPSAPAYVAGCDTSGYAYAVALSGNFVYIADSSGGLVVMAIGWSGAVVPYVIGLSEADACSAIEDAGLAVGEINYEYSGTVPDGKVIDQNPPAGTDVEPNSVVDLVISLGSEPIKAHLWIYPRIIHRYSWCRRPSKIFAWLRLPEGVTPDQIDSNEPLLLFPDVPEANGIKAIHQFVFQNSKGDSVYTNIFAFFEKDELINTVPDNGRVELQVVGNLRTGQYFYGTDTVWIRSWRWRPWWYWSLLRRF